MTTHLFQRSNKWLILSMLLVVLALSFTVSAETTTVYKTRNPDGSITYSDQPDDDAEQMEVEPISTVPAYRPRATVRPKGNKKEEAVTTSTYQSLKIVEPGNNTAFFSGNGEVKVQAQLSPALARGHQLQFLLDGKLVATQSSGNLTLSLVDRGTHTLSVAVVDRNLKPLVTQSSTFTIHRPKVSRP